MQSLRCSWIHGIICIWMMYLTTCLYIHLSICLSDCPPIYLCLSYLSIYLYVCLIYLSIHQIKNEKGPLKGLKIVLADTRRSIMYTIMKRGLGLWWQEQAKCRLSLSEGPYQKWTRSLGIYFCICTTSRPHNGS